MTYTHKELVELGECISELEIAIKYIPEKRNYNKAYKVLEQISEILSDGEFEVKELEHENNKS